VFERRLQDGRTLTFMIKDDLFLEDAENGTTWDGLSGLAIEGQLSGMQLKPVKSTLAFWFGWKDWYPKTGVNGAG